MGSSRSVGIRRGYARKVGGALLVGAVLLATAVTAGAQPAPEAATGSPGGQSAPGGGAALATGRAVEASPADGATAPAANDTRSATPPLGDYTPEAYRAAKARAQQADVPEAAVGSALRLDAGVGKAGQPAAPTLSLQWGSFPFTGWNPPDAQVAVGPSNGVAAVNGGVKVFSKTGSQSASWSLESFFPATARCGTSSCPSGTTTFDPWVIYDSLSGRFVVLALARNATTKLSRIVLAVSKTSTASTSTSGWWMYGLDAKLRGNTSVEDWLDYAKVGVTNNALVITGNQFNWSNSFVTSKIKVLWKSQIYNGVSSVNWYDFWNLNGSPFGVHPASSSVSSTTAYLVNTDSSGSTQLKLRTLAIPTTTPGTPTLSAQIARTVSAYSTPPDARQPGSSTRIDTGDSRVTMAVRSAAGIFAVHTTSCTWSGVAEARSCIRYYQIDPGTLSVTKWGGLGNRDFFYSYPAVAADSSGGIVVPFQYSGATAYMSNRYTARAGTETSLQNSSPLGTGTGCFVRLGADGRNRQGDYSGASYDASTKKFWVMGEHSSGTSSTCSNNTWTTRIGVVNAP